MGKGKENEAQHEKEKGFCTPVKQCPIPSQYLLDHASAEKSNHVIISKGEGNKQQPLQILDTPLGNGKQPLHILDTPVRSLVVVVLETPPDVYENVYKPKPLASKQPISSLNIPVSSANGTTFEMQAILFDMYGQNFYKDDTQNGVDTQATQELNTQEVNGRDIENVELEDSAPRLNSQSSFGGTPSIVMSDLSDIRCNLEDRFKFFDGHVRNATQQQRQSTPSQANGTQHHHQGIPTQENVTPNVE
ncbi:hypothetical protein FRX31_026801 [Thalictrum thalictroides]|uniref:Uncharacterized protein n=1 Tax=Thalictrum thalictroides TaxID=46969 RepID=A0A7J6VH39_THATH|nr:hypothetical protein FRX31_026801 [Thalictrum thalictroides]